MLFFICTLSHKISRGENKIENLHSKFTLSNSKKTKEWYLVVKINILQYYSKMVSLAESKR